MSDPAMQGGPEAGGGAPPPAGASAPPPPPGQGTGASPATQPTANRGIQAAAMARIGNVVQMLHMIAAALGPGHEAERQVMQAITALSKAVPAGSASEGLLRADLQKMQMQQRQNSANAMTMRQGGQPPGGPTAPPAM